jgi:hypothetical protein
LNLLAMVIPVVIRLAMTSMILKCMGNKVLDRTNKWRRLKDSGAIMRLRRHPIEMGTQNQVHQLWQ